MLDREFDDFLSALKTYDVDVTPEIRVDERENPSRIRLKIKDKTWKQTLQNILQFSFINFTGVGAVRSLLCIFF